MIWSRFSKRLEHGYIHGVPDSRADNFNDRISALFLSLLGKRLYVFDVENGQVPQIWLYKNKT